MQKEENDLQRILASKRALRQRLQAMPVTEKLRLLDDLRDRTLTLRRARMPAASNFLREQPAAYRSKRSPKAEV